MATKNNPGKYDAYNKAEPDEPIFTLRGCDIQAEHLVRTWAAGRERLIEMRWKPETDREAVEEARACADAMHQYFKNRQFTIMYGR
jgi:hypothetical protein